MCGAGQPLVGSKGRGLCPGIAQGKEVERPAARGTGRAEEKNRPADRREGQICVNFFVRSTVHPGSAVLGAETRSETSLISVRDVKRFPASREQAVSEKVRSRATTMKRVNGVRDFTRHRPSGHTNGTGISDRLRLSRWLLLLPRG